MTGTGSHRQHNRMRSDVAHERCGRTAALYLRGRTYQEIAQELGISRETVFRDMRVARRLWRQRASRTYQKHLYEQLARLDEVENQAWIGWERSLGNAVEDGSETIDGTEGTTRKTSKKTKKQSGNPTFLKVVQDAVRQRSELLGLMDPDARNGRDENEEAQVIAVVIDSREEAEELRTFSLTEFREAMKAEVAAETLDAETA